MDIKLTTNHGGRFSVSICDSTTPSGITLKCFETRRLISVATGTTKWWIQDTSQDGWQLKMDWQLPADFTCVNGCTLMWEYYAMQTCLEACDCVECGSYCNGTNPVGGPRPTCLPTDTMEIFRNCADITITE